MTSGADYWLTIQNTNEVTMPLSGDEQEWYKQCAWINYLHKQMIELSANSEVYDEQNVCWQSMFSILQSHKKTLKQEHMLKHNLALTLISIGSNAMLRE